MLEDREDIPTKCVDVGCEIGSSVRHIACKYGRMTEGITSSPHQARGGNKPAKD